MKLSVGMHCIQTEKPSDFTAISFLVSRDWPHGADTRPLAGPGTGFQPCPASRRRPSSHVRDRRRPPSLRAPLQVLSAPRHRLPCCAQAPTTLHTPGTAFLFRWYCTALSCCPGCPRRPPWWPHKHSLGEQGRLRLCSTHLDQWGAEVISLGFGGGFKKRVLEQPLGGQGEQHFCVCL